MVQNLLECDRRASTGDVELLLNLQYNGKDNLLTAREAFWLGGDIATCKIARDQLPLSLVA